MNLAIIINGQLRTFFDKAVCDQFRLMLERCKTEYKLVYVCFIISGDYDHDIMNKYIDQITSEQIKCKLLIFDKEQLVNINDQKVNDSKFIALSKEYATKDYSCKAREIPSPTSTIHHGTRYLDLATYQFYQVTQGIQDIKSYENMHNLRFDVVMRTRFDTAYPNWFYPKIYHHNVDPLQKIYYSDHIRSAMGIPDIKHHIVRLSQQKFQGAECRVKDHMRSFGGAYFNNYMSLAMILQGSDDILYCFNDHFFFGKREVFMKLENFFSDFGMLPFDYDKIRHFYAQEAQLLIYCFHNNIQPIMYLGFHQLIR